MFVTFKEGLANQTYYYLLEEDDPSKWFYLIRGNKNYANLPGSFWQTKPNNW